MRTPAYRFTMVGIGVAIAVICASGAIAENGYMGTEKLDFVPLSGAPTIDGTHDAVWDAADWIQANDQWPDAPPPPSADVLSVRFKAGYFGSSMYLLVEVTDDERDVSATYGWDRDSVELYVDLQRIGGSMPDAAGQIANWTNDGGPTQFRFQVDEDGEIGWGGDITPDIATFVVNEDSAPVYMYEIELKAPATLNLADISSFGFALQANDAAGGSRDYIIGWWGGPSGAPGDVNDAYDPSPGQPSQDADIWAEAGFVGESLVDDPDLVVYYSFDEVGATVADQSPRGNDATVVGNVTAADGLVGGAALFAESGYLDLDGANFPASDIPTDGFTIAAWCNVENTQGPHALFNARSSDETWLIHPEIRAGDYRFTLRGDGMTNIANITTGTPVFDQWVHYAATYDMAEEVVTLYINGAVLTQVDADNVIPMPSDWDMGAQIGLNIDGARPFTGLMDEFYMFKRALSAAEVETLYSAGVATQADAPDVLAGGDSATVEDAEAAIVDAGFVVGDPIMRYSATVAEGLVMGQSPAAGTTLPTGSEISLIISMGPVPGYMGIQLHGEGTVGILSNAVPTDLGIEGANPKTVEVWVFMNNPWPEGSTYLFYTGRPSGTDGGRQFSIRTLGQPWFPPNTFRGQFHADDLDFSVPSMDRWAHFAVVSDGNEAYIYANGEQVAHRDSGVNGLDAGGSPFAAGMQVIGDLTRTIDGYIDDVRVWTVARTQAEIQANMHQYLTGDEPGLVLYWPLNEGAGDTAVDATGNGFDGDIGDGTWVVIEGAPDLIGLTQEQAESQITAAGYTVGEVTVELEGGLVGSQNPLAGHRASPGHIFDLVISLEPGEMVEVPDLVIEGEWWSIADVEAALATLGLNVGTITQSYSSTVPEGLVMGQSPAAGSLIPEGGSVNLVVSRGPAPTDLPLSGLAVMLMVFAIMAAALGSKTLLRSEK